MPTPSHSSIRADCTKSCPVFTLERADDGARDPLSAESRQHPERPDLFQPGPAVDIPFPDADAIRPDQAMKLMVIGETQGSAGQRPRPYKLAAA
jgi:hypothetical protein